MRKAVILFGWLEDYPLRLASPLLSGSPRWVAPLAFFTRYATYSMVATCDGYGIPSYSSTSLDVLKACHVPITGQPASVTPPLLADRIGEFP